MDIATWCRRAWRRAAIKSSDIRPRVGQQLTEEELRQFHINEVLRSPFATPGSHGIDVVIHTDIPVSSHLEHAKGLLYPGVRYVELTHQANRLENGIYKVTYQRGATVIWYQLTHVDHDRPLLGVQTH